MSEKIKITGTTEDGRKFTGEAVVEEQRPYRKPKDREKYWYINSIGLVEETTWNSHEFDIICYNFGNVFFTKEEAEKEARARKLVQMAQRIGGGGKYYIYYNEKNELKVGNMGNTVFKYMLPLFQSKELAQQFIDDYRDELMWYFGEYRKP